MHVCHFVNQLAHGGLETILLDLIQLSEDRVDHTVAYLGGNDEMRERFGNAGATVEKVGVTSPNSRNILSPPTMLKVRRFFQHRHPDIVHAHSPLFVLVLARLSNALPLDAVLINTYHNTSWDSQLRMRVAESATRRFSRINVSVSKSVEQSFTGTSTVYDPETTEPPLDSSYTIYNGIHVDAFRDRVRNARPPDVAEDVEGGPFFLNVGRYISEKRQMDLIQAMDDVVETRPDAALAIIGWGPLEERLSREVNRLGLEGNVFVTGRIEDIEPWYSLADAYVFSSSREGMPVVLIEAMSSELPIVATDIPSANEVLGGLGERVPPGEPGQLARAMLSMWGPDNSPSKGVDGFERAKELFSIRRMVESYVDLYQKLV